HGQTFFRSTFRSNATQSPEKGQRDRTSPLSRCFALYRAPADIAAAETSRPIYFVDCGIGVVARLRHAVPQSTDVENATAIGKNPAILRTCSCVENFNTLDTCCLCKPGNF